jgi:prophage regulatory protein
MALDMLISFDDLKSYGIVLTRPAIRSLARKGKFPKPVRVGDHHVAWHEEEILDWLATLPRADDAPLARRKNGKVVKLKAMAKACATKRHHKPGRCAA